MSIGDRLRTERESLGLSQPKFAAIAGTTKQTLFSWESGKTAPDGFQLAALAVAGVNVGYVLTGEREGPAPEVLTAEERVMLDYFRQASPQVRKAALGALLSAGLPAIGNAMPSTITQTISAPVWGGVAGGNIHKK
ncbi:helix-turn-helix domain-containing protein [Rhodoferax sp. BLA1]|uniref:helix-turn-helix domain-containing protein n=1 Tax=Rhodoferax sp. BLA1 TaxID=2576062 RepID=UPI0015D257B0|nr:helix-turn-helix domain-containing protein [Rhodoferax sp. BLA1]